MISLYQAAGICYGGAAGAKALGAPSLSLILDYAEPIGFQDFGEFGKVELFRLRKEIPGHPKYSTVSRETLDKALRELHPKYGETAVGDMDLPKALE